MGHERLVRLVRPMNTTDRILGEAKRKVRPPTEKELTDPQRAYLYARDVLNGGFPEAEAAIATDSWDAYFYAKNVHNGRFPEGEEAMAKDPRVAEKYIKRFPKAKREWTMRGWLDWFDL